MKKLEVAVSALAGLAFAMLAFFALLVLGTVIYNGPAQSRAYAATAEAEADTPATQAAKETADAPEAPVETATAEEAAPAGPYADLADDDVVTLDPEIGRAHV